MEAEQKSQGTTNGSDIMLALLKSVEQNHQVTQRTLASELGIALGLANAYLKRCIRKGLIKISAVPPRRYSYYLTPEGFLEKGRLTSQYLQASFGFFRAARQQCELVLQDCEARGRKRIVLFGASELAEVALLCARDRGTTIVGVVDPNGEMVGGIASVRSLDDIQGWDAILLTTLKDPQAAYDRLTDTVSPDLVVMPRLLNVSRTTSIVHNTDFGRS